MHQVRGGVADSSIIPVFGMDQHLHIIILRLLHKSHQHRYVVVLWVQNNRVGRELKCEIADVHHLKAILNFVPNQIDDAPYTVSEEKIPVFCGISGSHVQTVDQHVRKEVCHRSGNILF